MLLILIIMIIIIFINCSCTKSELLFIPTKYLSAKPRHCHGIANIRYNSRNILATIGRHAYKTTLRHQKDSLLCKVSRWHSHHLRRNKNQPPRHQIICRKYTQEHKTQHLIRRKNSIDFLDLSITRTHNKLTIDIYRKPTTTNTTINCMSNHPLEHEMAAYR